MDLSLPCQIGQIVLPNNALLVRRTMKDLVDLAISMTEIDTGINLSLQEREDMVKRIMAKVEGINQ